MSTEVRVRVPVQGPMRQRARLPWPLVAQILGVVAAVWLFVHTWQLWMLTFVALIVAAAILPAARTGERYRIPRGVTVFVVYLAVAAVLALVGRLLWPALTEQWKQFVDQSPRLMENVRSWLGRLDVLLWSWGASLPTPKPEDLQALLGKVMANSLQLTAGVVGFIVGLLLILIIAAYLVIDEVAIGRGVLRLVPGRHRARVSALWPGVIGRIGGYVRGQIVASVCVGAVLAIALTLLGVRYGLLLGVLAAVLNIVPFVGSLVAAVLGILAALNESLGLAVGTALVFWGTNLIEGKFLAPHFVGRATGLHPLAVLLALFMGLHLAGLIGALVAVPLVAAVWEILRATYVDS
jgi:predicted PurR-regulated permease PerM